MPRLMIFLEDPTFHALSELAWRQRRDVREQAAVLVEFALRHLVPEDEAADAPTGDAPDDHPVARPKRPPLPLAAVTGPGR